MQNEEPLVKKDSQQSIENDELLDSVDGIDTEVDIENLSFDVDGDASFYGSGNGTANINNQTDVVETENEGNDSHDYSQESPNDESSHSLPEERDNVRDNSLVNGSDDSSEPSSNYDPQELSNDNVRPETDVQNDTSNEDSPNSKNENGKNKDNNNDPNSADKNKKDTDSKKSFSDNDSKNDRLQEDGTNTKKSPESSKENINKNEKTNSATKDSKTNGSNKPDVPKEKSLNNNTPNIERNNTVQPNRGNHLNGKSKRPSSTTKPNGGKPTRIGYSPSRDLNKAGNGFKKAGGAVKDTAKKLGKQAGKFAKKIGEKVVKGFAALLKHPVILGIFVGIILMIIILLIVVPAFGSILTPGQGSDAKENFENFSEVDQKIIENINNKGYKPNAELALFAVAYPYFESLQEGGLDAYLDKNDESLSEEDKSSFQQWYSEKKNEILESFGCDDLCQDFLGEAGTEQIAKTYFKEYLKSKVLFWKNDCYDENGLIGASCSDDSNDFNGNDSDRDPYLTIFRKNKMIKKYSKLLEKLSSSSTPGDYSSEEEFFKYLKSDYFKDDAGYKALFDQTDRDDELSLTIIDDIKANAGSFSVYLKDNCKTSYNFQSGGQIEPSSEDIKQMMMGNVVIDLLDAGCGNTSTCSSYYSSPITLEKYIKGVVYEELDSSDDLEQIKAQMVAAKSYTLSRHDPSVTDDGFYVIKMRWSTADQDYCDYENGCEDVKAEYGYDNVGDCVGKCKHWSNRGPASEAKVALYDQAWEETKNVYVVDSDGVPRGNYMEGCSKGKCMDQAELEKMVNIDYQSILQTFYTDYALAVQEGEFATVMLGTSNKLCTNENGNGLGIPDDEFIFYYQFNYKNVAFCGASSFTESCASGSNSICSSGCGVTSFAMLISNLSSDTSFDPPKANIEAASNGGCGVGAGSNNSLFTQIAKQHDGFSYDSISMDLDGADKVIQVIKDGGLVAANVQQNSPFTGGGHWILMRGLTEDGKVKVADPNSKDRSLDGEYDIKEFINDKWFVDKGGTTHSWIAIYGPRSEEIKAANTVTVKSGDGVTTGYLKSPLDPNDTNEEARKKVGSNSQTLYYKNKNSGGYHGAIDFPVKENSKIYAMDGGIVERSEKGNAYGNYIIIKHTANSKTYYTLYAHLNKLEVKAGDKVSQGQEIGLSGNTGNSTGPHLHAELDSSISCLGHSCSGIHYNILKYIGLDKTYVGEKCDGKGC